MLDHRSPSPGGFGNLNTGANTVFGSMRGAVDFMSDQERAFHIMILTRHGHVLPGVSLLESLLGSTCTYMYPFRNGTWSGTARNLGLLAQIHEIDKSQNLWHSHQTRHIGHRG